MPDQGNSSTMFGADNAQNADGNVDNDNNSNNQAQQSAAVDHPLIGDGKKYADIDTALNALTATQTHIETIETENKQLRGEQQQASQDSRLTGLEQAIETFNSKLSDIGNSSDQNQGLSDEDVAQRVNATIDTRESNATKEANQSKVVDAFILKYGDKDSANEAFDKAAQAVNMTSEALVAMSGSSPEAVARLTGISLNEGSVTKFNSGDVNTTNMQGSEKAPEVKGIMVGASTEDVQGQWAIAGDMIKD